MPFDIANENEVTDRLIWELGSCFEPLLLRLLVLDGLL